MSALARTLRRNGLAALLAVLVVAMLLLLWAFLANPPWGTTSLSAVTARLDNLHGDALNEEKIRQEVLQLDLANRTAASPWSLILAFVPLPSALLAGVAVLITVWKQISERSDQLRQDREEREREHQRQFAESFKTTVENLAGDKPSLRASAAATLSTFLRPEYSDYQRDVLLVAIAKSKEGMEDSPTVTRLIVRAVELALRAQLPTIPTGERRYFLDLSHCQLRRIDLSGLDLTEADIGYADFHDANLTGIKLVGAQGIKVRLEGARLGAIGDRRADLQNARLRGAMASEAKFHRAKCVSIRLQDADLRKAEFYQAELQEARFDNADLTGATFNGANLNNAFFPGAKLDDAALRSIATGAENWRKAHFDPDALAGLNAISPA
jgi:uncharacterized protein YjbI with pentapeptide repeats